MFLGTFTPRLDEKGRITLPAKFREPLAGGLVMTKGQEHCLVVFTAADFTSYADRIRAAPMTTKPVRDYARVFFAGAEDAVPDRQGRVGIAAHLRAYAGLTRDCAVVGMGDHIEIWDAAAWERFLADSEPSYAEIQTEVHPGLF